MDEVKEKQIPPACNPECEKMRDIGIPNNIYKRCLYHLAVVSADQATLTTEQKSEFLANVNSLLKGFDQKIIARVLRQALSLFTEPLRKKISSLENEIERLKEKHFEEIQNRISTIDNISSESLSAIDKAGTDSVHAIQAGGSSSPEMKKEVSKQIKDALKSVQENMQAKTDILRKEAAESKAQACIDDLTGLPNKIGIVEYLRLTLPEAIKNRRQLTLMLLDIDRFKTINNNYSEKVGDQAIKLVAHEGIKKIVDQNLEAQKYFCARFQGDKFAVIINDPNLRSAMRIAELIRMKSRLLSNRLSEETGVYIYNTLKLSIGVAQTDLKVRELHKVIRTLITKANNALFMAKQGGGNRVVTEE